MDVKPCPLCGKESVIEWTHADMFCHVECTYCEVCGPAASMESEAVEGWNALPRREDIERLNREADWLAEHLHRSGVPCPGDGEKFDPYGECAEKDWPCIACFRKWAKQETQGEKSDGQEKGN